MPVVPIAQGKRAPTTPQRPPPEEPWALMAAAQMHSEGRLVDNGDKDTKPNGR